MLWGPARAARARLKPPASSCRISPTLPAYHQPRRSGMPSALHAREHGERRFRAEWLRPRSRSLLPGLMGLGRDSVGVGPIAEVTQPAPGIVAPAATTAVAAVSATPIPVAAPAAPAALFPAATASPLFPAASTAPTVLFSATPTSAGAAASAAGTPAAALAASASTTAAAAAASFCRSSGGRQDCAEGQRCDGYGRNGVANSATIHCTLQVTCRRNCTGLTSIARIAARLRSSVLVSWSKKLPEPIRLLAVES
jgi:hypothetical protein